MKTFVYFSLPGYGHVLPTLNVARELVKRGHKVIYYSTKRFKPMVEEAGVIFRDYGSISEIDGNLSRNLGLFVRLLAERAVEKIPHLVDTMKKDKPDCIMHDSLCPWGKIIAHATGIPAVSLTTSAAYKKRVFLLFPKLLVQFSLKIIASSPDVLKAYWIYYTAAKKYGVTFNGLKELVVSNEKLNIVFSLKTFTPFSKSYDKTFCFVGPSIYPRGEKETFLQKISSKTKIIYISFGTVINDDRTIFTTCINAFRNSSYHVVISLGDRFDPSDFSNIPANVTLKRYVNQLEVLERASVFITHAGMNSCMEGMYYGVPMLLIPDTEEQRFNALRIVGMGAGILLKKQYMNEKMLSKYVEELLATPSYVKDAKRMQKALHKAGGYKAAVDKIIASL